MPKRSRGNSFNNVGFGDRTLPVRKARSFVIASKPVDSTVCKTIKDNSIVDADNRRRLRESLGAPDRGRQEFSTVEYDPFQIEAYKSKYSRWIKSLDITPSSTASSVIGANTVTLYAFQSCESPTGFWQVQRTETEYETHFLGGQCSAYYVVQITVVRLGSGSGGTTIGQSYSNSVSATLFGPVGNPSFGPSISVPGQEAVLVGTGLGAVEVFGPWSRDDYTGHYITVDGIVLDGTDLLMEDGSNLLLEDGSKFLTERDTGIVEDTCGNPPIPPVQPGYGFEGAQCNIVYEIEVKECWTGTPAPGAGCVTAKRQFRGPLGGIFFTKNTPGIGFPFMSWVLTGPNVGGGGMVSITSIYNSTIYSSLTCEILSLVVAPPPANPAGTLDNCGDSLYEPKYKVKESVWDCTCPDKSKSLAADPRSSFRSRRIGKDWSSSNAGATEDCKHIYSAKTAAKFPFEIPTDVPAKLSMERKSAALDPFNSWAR